MPWNDKIAGFFPFQPPCWSHNGVHAGLLNTAGSKRHDQFFFSLLEHRAPPMKLLQERGQRDTPPPPSRSPILGRNVQYIVDRAAVHRTSDENFTGIWG